MVHNRFLTFRLLIPEGFWGYWSIAFFFSWWLLWEITLPSKLQLEAALTSIFSFCFPIWINVSISTYWRIK
ncbi:hypothetical protein JHK82_053214 [Glycine max]|nr:hypothetical protein JHK82_053214 [Glycine max]